ncbi:MULTISPECIES: substrate-binding domain-containing protein [unclassified Agarivorans]|uniref:substrate-binding domain-containing protein n=1 Tax=unclassified Agarivorans TaxID=2636026 RepID=UPI0026E29A69|nr:MULTISPECIES: substrate-binding domain-containing protein [unclassified Agarivorans]MDO6687459.1 substrate-binding domain-containing protein [Agarivorans sp. 3_MG-2023]MDO6715225.1 substrate-binding domain-containing protein [Agarivorans sp. 2_MG-2023]
MQTRVSCQRITVKDKSKLEQRSTVYDVAALAGVSPSTVSRFMNQTTYVSDAKRKQIQAAMVELGYKPGQQTGASASSRTMTIGVLVQHPDSPFYASILRGIEEVLLAQGYSHIIVTGHWNTEEETESMQLLLSRSVDGIIIVTGGLSDDQVLEFSKKRPIVALGRELEAARLRSIKIENSVGAYMATNHLIQLGHREIVHIKGNADHPDAQQRYEGYCQAMEHAGLPVKLQLVEQGDFTEQSGFDAVQRLLANKRQFSAIFAANDLTAYGAMQALYQAKRPVPERVSVIGFDDVPSSAFFIPPLTTVRQPIFDTGYAAALAILDMLNGGANQQFRLPPVELVTRETTQAHIM